MPLVFFALSSRFRGYTKRRLDRQLPSDPLWRCLLNLLATRSYRHLFTFSRVLRLHAASTLDRSIPSYRRGSCTPSPTA
eukprot:9442306-Pyramimonas_sp.AAC.1